MVVFRVDWGEKIGFGHLKRSLVYAKNFKNVVYISKSTQNLTPYPFYHIKDENQFFELIKKLNPKEVIVDNYQFNLEYQKKFKTIFENIKLSIFDDEYKDCICDEIINHNLGVKKYKYKNPAIVRIIPPLIRDEFKNIKIPKKREGIFISLGGVDSKGLTLKLIKLLKNHKLNIYITSQNRHLKLLKKYKNHKNINLFIDKDVAKGMANSKFGIITPSVISYEAIYMKLPFVAIKTAKNQKEVARYLKKRYKVIDAKKLYTIKL